MDVAIPSVGTALAGAAGITAAAAYLNAKFHIYHDLTGPSFRNLLVLKFVWTRLKKDRLLLFHLLEEQAHNPQRANSPFIWFEGKEHTWAETYKAVVGVANHFLKDLGIKRNEIVALYGGNSPEYIIIWLALDAIGACPSFLNCNLTGGSLMHCVKICDARYLLCEEVLSANIEPSRVECEELKINIIKYSPESLSECTDQSPLPKDRQSGWQADDLKSLMYTSGTTGFPKAIIMPAAKELAIGYSIARHLKLKPTDRFYTCMPLYHGAAHGLLVSPSLAAGNTIVLGRKFSHKTFWPEVRESKANIVQYVGELCRYLLNAPPSPHDKDHNVQMVWGNGMRPDVWEPFRERFGIPTVNELYAASDGVGSSFEENKGPFTQHAIGKRGLIWRLTSGMYEKRVRIDADTQEILRDSNGFAIECDVNEPGEVLHRLDPKAPQYPQYYKNDAATKRLLRNVFKKGDLWFRSGDMHRMDADGRVYFVDRLGDTFRWKSENVSTNEVADILGRWPQIAEANVYGVQVPRSDGRCGCAAVVFREGVTKESFDFKGLGEYMLKSLPRYAVPIFIRITKALEYTGTLKIQKGRLRREGIELDQITGGDEFYWMPIDSKEYVPFRKTDLEALKSGQARL